MCKKFFMALLFLLVPMAVNASVLTFDDIGITPVTAQNIPSGYGGFDWNSIHYLDPSIVTTDSGYANGIISGDYVALVSNYFHEGIGWLAGDPFTFQSAYLTSVWRDDLVVQVDGYFNNVLTYSTMVTIKTTSPTLCEFNYVNIDELHFTASGGITHEGYLSDYTQFVMDDFTYVPEPGSILLFMGTALALRKRH